MHAAACFRCLSWLSVVAIVACLARPARAAAPGGAPAAPAGAEKGGAAAAAPGVAAPGVAAPGVAAPGVAAPGVAAPGVAAAAAPKLPPELLKRAGELLDAALADKAGPLRGEALTALGLSRRPGARAQLEKALGELDGELRFGAARGLRLLRDPAAVPAIETAWAKETGWAVRSELALAAGATGGKKLIPELLKALDDPRPELKASAAWALFDLGDRAGPEALARLGSPRRKGAPKDGTDRWSRKVLAGEKEGDRALAARTLAEQGVLADGPLLGQQLGAPDASVRLWAAAGVLRLGL